MVVSRIRPRGVRYYGPFGLSVLVLSLLPRQSGYQDIAALMARQPEVTQRARAHMLASPFGTIHAATFSFPQPVGTRIPEPPRYRIASIGGYDADDTNGRAPLASHRTRLEFPSVNRTLKGDLLVSRPHEEPMPGEGSRDITPGLVKTSSFLKPADAPAGLKAEADVVMAALSLNRDPENSQSETKPSPYVHASLAAQHRAQPEEKTPLVENIDDTKQAARFGWLYFGNNPLGEAVGPIQPWPIDQEIVIQTPPANDPDIKRSTSTPPLAAAEGQTVAPKGEVTGSGNRPRTPAERLGLDVKTRAKAEKCLAEVVYFESRGEPKRGQIAIAQVVMNRAFSGYYPTSVCGVVYQNAHRKLACQFSFACDGIPEAVTQPDMWEQAKQIAHDMLDGKLWLPEVGHSTHFHAYWVHPSWVNEMKRLHKIGVHSFYRPRAWGDGSEVPPLAPPQVRLQVDDAAMKAKL